VYNIVKYILEVLSCVKRLKLSSEQILEMKVKA